MWQLFSMVPPCLLTDVGDDPQRRQLADEEPAAAPIDRWAAQRVPTKSRPPLKMSTADMDFGAPSGDDRPATAGPGTLQRQASSRKSSSQRVPRASQVNSVQPGEVFKGDGINYGFLHSLFAKVDKDSSGDISVTELHDWLNMQGGGKPLTFAEVKKLLDEMGHESLDVRMGQQQFVKFLATLQKSDPKGWHDGRLAVFEVPKVPLSAQALEDSRMLKKLLAEAAERDRKAADAARRGQADDFMAGGPIGMSKSAAMEWERAEAAARKDGKTLVGIGPKGEHIHRMEPERVVEALAPVPVLTMRVQKWVDKDRSASVTTAGSKSRPSTASGGSRATRSKKGGKARPGTAGSGGRSGKALFGPPAEGGFRPNVGEQQSLTSHYGFIPQSGVRCSELQMAASTSRGGPPWPASPEKMTRRAYRTMIKGGLSVHEACLKDAAERNDDNSAEGDASRRGSMADDAGGTASHDARVAEVLGADTMQLLKYSEDQPLAFTGKWSLREPPESDPELARILREYGVADADEAHRMAELARMEEEMIGEATSGSRPLPAPHIPGERARSKRNEQKFLALGYEGGQRDRSMANGGRLTVAERLDRALEYAATHNPHTPVTLMSTLSPLAGHDSPPPEHGQSHASPRDAVKSSVSADFFRPASAKAAPSLRSQLT